VVPLTSLWAPILLSAVVVFLASFVVHMVLPFHRRDWGKVPSEDAVMDALRPFAIAPGDYMLPCARDREAMKSPEFKEKFKRGPVALITVLTGEFTMGKRLAQWFVYLLVVGALAGLVAGTTLPPGAPHEHVFHLVALVAFASYGLALWQNSIWYSRSWLTTLKSNVDALIYALLTAAIFGWLWPTVA
jgi:hypothetical protein